MIIAPAADTGPNPKSLAGAAQTATSALTCEAAAAATGNPLGFELSWTALLKEVQKSADLLDTDSNSDKGTRLPGSEIPAPKDQGQSLPGTDERTISLRNKQVLPDLLECTPASCQAGGERPASAVLANSGKSLLSSALNSHKSRKRPASNQTQERSRTEEAASQSVIMSAHLPLTGCSFSLDHPVNACSPRIGTEASSETFNPDPAAPRLRAQPRNESLPVLPGFPPQAKISPESEAPHSSSYPSAIAETTTSASVDIEPTPNRNLIRSGEEPQVTTDEERSLPLSSARKKNNPERIEIPPITMMSETDGSKAHKDGVSSKNVTREETHRPISAKRSEAFPAIHASLESRDKGVIDRLEPRIQDSTILSSPKLAVNHETASVQGREQNSLRAADEATKTMDVHWLHAGARRAEAGFRDPSLGWVTVRAEQGSGGVHASIIPPSQYATQVLDGHISDLRAHLVGAHLPIRELTIVQTNEARLDSMSGGFGSHADSGTHPDQRQQQQSCFEDRGLSQASYNDSSGNGDSREHSDLDLFSALKNGFDTPRLHVSLVA